MADKIKFSLNNILKDNSFDYISALNSQDPDSNNFEFSDSPYDNPSINCTYLDENEFASRPVTCQYFLSIFKVFPLNFLNYHNLYTI